VHSTIASVLCYTLPGKRVSISDDPFRVAGMPAVDGPTGLRPDHPAPAREVERTDGGELDNLAVLAIDDVEEFWRQHYPEISSGGSFTPVDQIISYDSTSPAVEDVCGRSTYELVNAFFSIHAISSRGIAASCCPMCRSPSATWRLPKCWLTSTAIRSNTTPDWATIEHRRS
jgi:predicted metalloprotease